MVKTQKSILLRQIGHQVWVDVFLATHGPTNIILSVGNCCPGLALLATSVVLNWQLGLVMMGCVPFIGASVAILTQLMSGSTQEGNDYYAKAGGVATEVNRAVNKQQWA